MVYLDHNRAEELLCGRVQVSKKKQDTPFKEPDTYKQVYPPMEMVAYLGTALGGILRRVQVLRLIGENQRHQGYRQQTCE